MASKDNENPMKKYVVLESILNSINSRAIALQNHEIKRNNVILSVVSTKKVWVYDTHLFKKLLHCISGVFILFHMVEFIESSNLVY